MAFWEDEKYAQPLLYKLACIVHAVPATQVTCERSFSAYRIVLNEKRYNLHNDTLEKIM